MIQPQDWRIYAAKLPSQSITYSSIATTVPIVVNATSLDGDERETLRKQGCVFDDEGENISSLNPFFCELTSIYWMLNNAEDKYIGNAHYRRKWGDDGLKHSEEGVLYVAHEQCFHGGLAKQFLDNHHGLDAPAITIGLAEQGVIPFSASQMRAVWEQPMFYGYQMARGPSKYYKAFMNLAFDCLWPIWDRHQEEIKTLDPYNRRMMGFIGERIMTGLVLCRDSFFDFPIATSQVTYQP